MYILYSILQGEKIYIRKKDEKKCPLKICVSSISITIKSLMISKFTTQAVDSFKLSKYSASWS